MENRACSVVSSRCTAIVNGPPEPADDGFHLIQTALPSNATLLEKYAALDQKGSIMVEYIWIDSQYV